ncbi:hypothetical protein MUN82_10780 [Hymenobacter aerilatus]|uniref:Uncharacterized protein n=1 Tax=Hymenobacter aerilatus TaxID=2932251 RepID=A0A8T9T6W7_9BACT|nr:hypothetical protein [Hymenobacter aerilatus]UOR07559.1 hypothetical protein MUN82_10780 [Hymenobacter aerilatus]
MRLSYLILSATLTAGFFSCTTSTEPSATSPDLVTPPTPDSSVIPHPNPAISQNKPVTLVGRTFRIHSIATRANNADGTAPLFAIYLHPNGLRDSVLAAQDTEPSELEPDRKAKLGVPKTAVILFQTYYAGAGYYYYAAAEDNLLRIYRKQLEEATSNNAHSPLPQWQLFKTFAFFADGVQQESVVP